MVSRNGTFLDQAVFTLQALAWVYFLEVETLIYVTTSRLASSVGLRAGLGLGRACVSVNNYLIYVNLPQARATAFFFTYVTFTSSQANDLGQKFFARDVDNRVSYNVVATLSKKTGVHYRKSFSNKI